MKQRLRYCPQAMWTVCKECLWYQRSKVAPEACGKCGSREVQTRDMHMVVTENRHAWYGLWKVSLIQPLGFGEEGVAYRGSYKQVLLSTKERQQLRAVINTCVRQDYRNDERIEELYREIFLLARNVYSEDNLSTLKGFLDEQYQRAMTKSPYPEQACTPYAE